MTTYKIVRSYSSTVAGNFSTTKRTIRTGLTLEEAKAHCSDYTTSSHGRKDPRKGNRAWFDGFTQE